MPSVGVVWVLSSEEHTHNSIDTQSLSSTHTHTQSTLPERERRQTGAEATAEPASPATPSVSLTTPTLVNLSTALTCSCYGNMTWLSWVDSSSSHCVHLCCATALTVTWILWNWNGPDNSQSQGLQCLMLVGFLMYLFTNDFSTQCLVLFCNLMMFYDCHQCVMSVLGTTKHSHAIV